MTEAQSTGIFLVVGLVAAIAAIWLFFWALGALLTGAAVLLGFASRQGFLGLLGFVAAWVFLLPVMALLSVVLGFFSARTQSLGNKDLDKINSWRRKNLGEKPWEQDSSIPPDDPVERQKWANREPPYER